MKHLRIVMDSKLRATLLNDHSISARDLRVIINKLDADLLTAIENRISELNV